MVSHSSFIKKSCMILTAQQSGPLLFHHALSSPGKERGLITVLCVLRGNVLSFFKAGGQYSISSAKGKKAKAIAWAMDSTFSINNSPLVPLKLVYCCTKWEVHYSLQLHLLRENVSSCTFSSWINLQHIQKGISAQFNAKIALAGAVLVFCLAVHSWPCRTHGPQLPSVKKGHEIGGWEGGREKHTFLALFLGGSILTSPANPISLHKPFHRVAHVLKDVQLA